jgi:hypothetical protein
LFPNIKQIMINHIKSYILLFHSSVSLLDLINLWLLMAPR